MQNRLDRVNEIMRRELGDLVRREMVFDAQLVTIQQVDITPDLKQAHIFVSVIGTEEQQRAAMAGLHAKRKRLQSELSKRVVIKYTPQLHFKLDTASERGDRVLQLLAELGSPLPEVPGDSDPVEPEDRN
jgi:ribosome-binding factor A